MLKHNHCIPRHIHVSISGSNQEFRIRTHRSPWWQFLTVNSIGFIHIWKIHFWMSLNKEGPSWKWDHHPLSQDAGLNQKKKHSSVHTLSSSGIWIWMQSNRYTILLPQYLPCKSFTQIVSSNISILREVPFVEYFVIAIRKTTMLLCYFSLSFVNSANGGWFFLTLTQSYYFSNLEILSHHSKS